MSDAYTLALQHIRKCLQEGRCEGLHDYVVTTYRLHPLTVGMMIEGENKRIAERLAVQFKVKKKGRKR